MIDNKTGILMMEKVMNLPSTRKYLHLLFILVLLTSVASCSGLEIVGSSSSHVWIRNPALSMGDSDKLAQKYCAGLGKKAELEEDLTVAEGANNILVYACK